jgi:hypothetical protein
MTAGRQNPEGQRRRLAKGGRGNQPKEPREKVKWQGGTAQTPVKALGVRWREADTAEGMRVSWGVGKTGTVEGAGEKDAGPRDGGGGTSAAKRGQGPRNSPRWRGRGRLAEDLPVTCNRCTVKTRNPSA